MMINLKLLDYLILMLLLLKGLLCKHHRTSHYSSEEPPASNNNKLGDLESDYFKIFSDIKDMRSKVPDYYNTDITFDSEKAFSLLRDPVTYKRASIMNPIDPFDNVYTGANDDESTTRDQNDRILKALMDFQKRQDDPMHQTHGVGEGLASLPTTKKSKDGKLTTAENFMGSAKDTKSSRDGDSPKISEEGKTKIYASDSLGMVRQSIEHPAAEKNNTLNNTMVLNTTESSHVRNRTEPNSNLTASQNSSTAESAPIKNVTDSFNNTSNIPPLLFQALKNLAVDNDTTTTASTALMSDNTTANTTSNDSSSIVSNVTTRNMITDATIKGFLARSDSFTIYDVGKRTTETYNDTASFPAKMSSNFVEVRSNISYAEQENTTTHSDSVNSNSTSNITRDAASYSPDNVTVSTMTAANNTSKDVNNETIASKLAQMLGNDSKTSVHKGEAHQNEADVKGEAKTLIQQHVHHFYSPVHLTKVTDEMRSGHETSRLDASPFTESAMARKKDVSCLFCFAGGGGYSIVP